MPGTSSERRYTWAELLLRVLAIDVLSCPHCGGRRKLIAGAHHLRNDASAALRFVAARRTGAHLTDGVVVCKILDHLGLPTEPPDLAPVRVRAERSFDA